MPENQTQTKTFTYEIGGKKYTQGPLKFIQLQQLTSLLSDIIISGNLTEAAVAFHIISNGIAPRFMAIILVPEGKTLKQKNLEELAEELMYESGVDDSEIIVKVVEDFFDCNLEPSRSGRVKEAINSLTEKMMGMIPSKKPSAPSQEEISLKEKTSSTDSAQEKQSPTLSSEEESPSSESASSASSQEEKA